MVGDEPLAILENYLPDTVGTASGIDAVDLTTTGLYRAMREAGVRLCVAKQRIAAREGTPEEGELLGEAVGGPLLTWNGSPTTMPVGSWIGLGTPIDRTDTPSR